MTDTMMESIKVAVHGKLLFVISATEMRSPVYISNFVSM